MKLIELANVCQSTIKVLDGGNGKVLSYRFTKNAPDKKKDRDVWERLGNRDVLSAWAGLQNEEGGFSEITRAVIKCYVAHED